VELKRYSRKDEMEGNIPLSAEFVRHEPDSDFSWYKVLTDDEIKRIADYYGIELY